MNEDSKQPNTSKAKVIIPGNLTNPPEQHEIDTAWILALHFDCEISFIKPNQGYKIKTPDIEMLGSQWELKSPVGKSREHTIKRQFMNAKGKRHHLIIDGRRTPLHDDFVVSKIRLELKAHKDILRLIYVKKTNIVLEIK